MSSVCGVSEIDTYRRLKADRRVAVCVPCRNEADTIGQLVAKLHAELAGAEPLIDELVVVDDNSNDDSAAIAADAGAKVVAISEVNGVHGQGRGKGNVLWASLLQTTSDVIVWCDADVTNLRARWVLDLATPLLADPELALVKGSYERSTAKGGGGRTTELVARPLISLFFPELAHIAQPLAGEYAVRREAAEQIPFVQGWGVEIAMLIDIAERFGADSIGQVDLGTREHRHRELLDLSVQAAEVMAAALSRTMAGKPFDLEPLALHRADGGIEPLTVVERPPISSLR